MCEIHPGSPQERQQCVLQAQEQPPAGGVGAHNSIVQPSASASSAALECSDWGRLNTDPPPTPKTLVSRTITPVPTLSPKMTVQLFGFLCYCFFLQSPLIRFTMAPL